MEHSKPASVSNPISMTYGDTFAEIMTIAERSKSVRLWMPHKQFLENLQKTIEGFDTERQEAEQDINYIFAPVKDFSNQTDKTISLIKFWCKNAKAPSLLGMGAYALEKFGFKEDDTPLMHAVLMACALGDLPHKLSYHNNLHFQKVFLQCIRLIEAHNTIFGDDKSRLNRRQIALLLAGAAVHDLGHTGGQGNIEGGKYNFANLEKRSFNYAEPFLRMAGFDESMLEDLKVMILATDATQTKTTLNPVGQMRQAYQAHEEGNPESLDLSEELELLKTRKDLALLCMLLHEADIFTSAGLNYEITKFESALVAQETGRRQAIPEDIRQFQEDICEGSMVSDAASAIGGDNFKGIYRSVMQDIKDGNKPFTATLS